MAGNTIDILFGVKGGGLISGKSGKNILLDIQSIISQIEKKGVTNLKFGINTSSFQDAAQSAKVTSAALRQLRLEKDAADKHTKARISARRIEQQESRKTQQINNEVASSERAAAAASRTESAKITLTKKQESLARSRAADAAKKETAELNKHNKTMALESKNYKKYEQLSKIYQNNKDQIKAKGFEPEVTGLLAKFKSDGFENVADAELTFDTLNRKMKESGVYADNFSGKVKKLFSDNFNTTIAAAGVHALQTSIRQLYQNVVALDSVVTDLQVATGYSREDVKNLVKDYSGLAKELGATTVETSRVADTWLRQGKSIEETNELITQTMYLSKLGQIDEADAAMALTSALKGYKLEAADAASVVDKLVSVDMVAAASSGGIAVAMAECANSADMAGISLDRLIGYLTVIKEVTQDGDESVGTFAKTMFARMGNIKTGRLEDPETGESLSDVETVLSGLGIKLRDTNSEFRNLGDVLDEVASKWDSYSSVQQHSIAQAFGNTRNQEKFLVLMENYGDALSYMDTAAGSAGTAARKYEEAYLSSIEAAQNRFTANFESLSTAVLDGGLVSGLMDMGTAIIHIITPLLSLIGIFDGLPIKIAAVTAGIILLNKAIAVVQGRGIISGLSKIPNLLFLVSSKLFGVGSAASIAMASTVGLKATLESIGGALINSPTGWIMMIAGITKAITVFTDSWQKADERLSREISDNESKIQEYSDEISSLENLHDKLVEAKGDRVALASIYEELNKHISVTPKLLNGETGAWKSANAELEAYIEAEKQHKKDLAYENAQKYQQQFDNKGIVKTGLFGWDWAASDDSGSDLREKAKYYWQYVQDSMEKEGMSLEDAKKRAQSMVNALTMNGAASTSIGSEEWEKYWNEQVEIANNAFSDVISTYDGPGGTSFASEVLETLVRSGLSSEEILTELPKILNNSDFRQAYNNFIESLSNPNLDATAAFKKLDDEMDKIRTEYPGLASAFNLVTDAAKNMMKGIEDGQEPIPSFVDSLTLTKEQLKELSDGEGSLSSLTNRLKELENQFSTTGEKAEEYRQITKALSTQVAADNLKDIQSAANTAHNAIEQFTEDGKISNDSILAIYEAFGETEGFEKYIGVLTSSSSTIQEMEDALNNLYGEYISQSNLLQNVNETNVEYVETQLKALGVTNAHDVAISALVLSTKNLTSEKIEYNAQLLAEQGANSTLVTSYKSLATAFVTAQNSMNTAMTDSVKNRLRAMGVEVEGIKSVSDAYSALTKAAVAKYNENRNAVFSFAFDFSDPRFEKYARAVLGDDVVNQTIAYGKAAEEQAAAQARLQALLSKISATQVEVPDLSPDGKKSSKKEKTAGEKASDAWSKYYKDLQHKRSLNLISDKKYYNELAKNYRGYLKNYEETADTLKSVQEELYENLKKLYKEDLEKQKDALEKKKDDLKEFYDKQKQMLEDQYDEEDKKRKREEYAKDISQLRILIDALKRDTTQEAKRRLAEAEEELAQTQKEYKDWERDNAKEAALDTIDKMYEKEAASIDSQIEKIDTQVENIDNGVTGIYGIIKNWAKSKGYRTDGLATGTSSALGGWYRTQEHGAEALGLNLGSGQFTYLTPKSKVWNASATEVLYNFANSPARFLSQYAGRMRESIPVVQPNTVSVGDIIIHGNADSSTVTALRKERNNITYTVLEQLKKLKS